MQACVSYVVLVRLGLPDCHLVQEMKTHRWGNRAEWGWELRWLLVAGRAVVHCVLHVHLLEWMAAMK